MGVVALLLFGLAAVAAGVGAWQAWARVGDAERPVAGVKRAAGSAAVLAGLGWAAHAAGRGAWVPLADNVNALGLMGLVAATVSLAGAGWRRAGWVPAGLLPVAAAALVGAAVAGAWRVDDYAGQGWLLAVHRASTYSGVIVAALAAAAGGAYLVLAARLRARAAPSPQLGSLARLEAAGLAAAAGGFALLTVGLATGVGRLDALLAQAAGGVKLALVILVWAIFGVAAVSALAPRLRGRGTALLSLAGFGLLAAAVVVVQLL